jgi:hypothetical protein
MPYSIEVKNGPSTVGIATPMVPPLSFDPSSLDPGVGLPLLQPATSRLADPIATSASARLLFDLIIAIPFVFMVQLGVGLCNGPPVFHRHDAEPGGTLTSTAG